MSQSSVSGLPTIKLIGSRLVSMVDFVNHRVLVTNLIWFNTSAISNSRFIETLKYGMLEVQEHLETFCDKKEQASMVIYKNFKFLETLRAFLSIFWRISVIFNLLSEVFGALNP